MTKIKNTSPSGNLTPTTLVKYMGTVPDCVSPEDCSIDKTNLDYLISILLERYCLENEIIDADMSSIDLACILDANSDIELPEDITVGTLSQYYQDHLCSIYTKISELASSVSNINGIICMNDLVTLEEDTSITIDSLFNDVLLGLSGNAVLTITTEPINGGAVVSSNSIIYTPDTDFTGNDSIIYQIVKGSFTCSGKIKIVVTPVVDEETITEIVIEQLTTLLQSNEYWDIGIPIGTKMAISGINLIDFTLTGGSWGAGKVSTKWTKWAIANGNNGTEDHKQATLRGFDINDSDYDASAEAGGSDTLTLSIDNIPPHKHKTMHWTPEDDDETKMDAGSTAIAGGETWTVGSRSYPAEWGSWNTVWSTGETGDDSWAYTLNTGDGTDVPGGDLELKVSPDALNIVNAYTVIVLIQKIA